MIFDEQVRNFANRVSTIKESILTEEATKTSIVMPFFQMLMSYILTPTLL